MEAAFEADPDDVYTYIPDLSTDKYENSVGMSTGTYYAVDGGLYEMVFVSQSDPKCQSKAEAINYLFTEQGLIYGRDYDLLRVYNYEEDYQNGPRPDDFDFHCVYAYKAMSAKDASGLTSNSAYEGAYRNGNSLAVKTLVAMEIVKGTSPSTLSLDAPLTRGELAVLLSRTLEHVSSGMGMMPPGIMGPDGMPGMPGGPGGPGDMGPGGPGGGPMPPN